MIKQLIVTLLNITLAILGFLMLVDWVGWMMYEFPPASPTEVQYTFLVVVGGVVGFGYARAAVWFVRKVEGWIS